jgi:hypothetical protein
MGQRLRSQLAWIQGKRSVRFVESVKRMFLG